MLGGSQPSWVFWRRKKILSLYGKSKNDSSVVLYIA
jgi:hypothetical protein